MANLRRLYTTGNKARLSSTIPSTSTNFNLCQYLQLALQNSFSNRSAATAFSKSRVTILLEYIQDSRIILFGNPFTVMLYFLLTVLISFHQQALCHVMQFLMDCVYKPTPKLCIRNHHGNSFSPFWMGPVLIILIVLHWKSMMNKAWSKLTGGIVMEFFKVVSWVVISLEQGNGPQSLVGPHKKQYKAKKSSIVESIT